MPENGVKPWVRVRWQTHAVHESQFRVYENLFGVFCIVHETCFPGLHAIHERPFRVHVRGLANTPCRTPNRLVGIKKDTNKGLVS